MKKLLSILLSLILALSSVALLANAAEYNDIPCVIIPGIGQSRAWLVDDNGEYVLNSDGEKIHCFPGNFDVQQILSDVAGPLAMSVATQSDAGLSDALCDSLEKAFYMNKTDDNGIPCGYVNVETYPHSLAECTEEQRQYIFDCIPMQRMGETIGFENMYYYAYNSFGNAIDMINGLYDFIQLVKQQTGKDKINIIPISMGGAIFNGLMELHPEVANDLHRVVFVVPALNGSLIVSDIYQRELTFLDADYLYSDFFDGILGETNASAIEIAIRVLPKDVLMSCLEKAVERLINNVFANCTGIWMLVPNDQYDKCVKMTLSDKSKAEIRRQTNIYHKAQSNSNKNILKLMGQGVEVFDVLGYDVPLYNVGNSWNSQNADGVIHTYSTSIGAKMANVGETLGENYKQKNTYCKTSKAVSFFDMFKAPAASTVVQCSDPTHNHVSPDNVVDASTGLLPDYTFYFDNQAHATANQNDIIMRLCCELVETDRIKDVYTDENFPQFNVGRATKELREQLLPTAKAIDPSTLSDADRQELEQAVADAEAMLSRTIAVEGEAPAVEQRLRSILEKIGAVEPAEGESALSPIVKTISDTLLSLGGAKGYTDIPKDLISDLTKSNTDDNTSDDNGNTNDTNNNVTPTNTNTNNQVTPTPVSTSSTAANNPKTTSGYATGSLYVSVAAFAAFSLLATVKIKKKKDE